MKRKRYFITVTSNSKYGYKGKRKIIKRSYKGSRDFSKRTKRKYTIINKSDKLETSYQSPLFNIISIVLNLIFSFFGMNCFEMISFKYVIIAMVTTLSVSVVFYVFTKYKT